MTVFIAVESPYKERVEAAAKQNLGNATVLRMQEVHGDRVERVTYWERAYIIAWVNEDQSGTHRVCINSEGDSMCLWGHFFPGDTDGDKALDHFGKRSR